MEPRSSEEGLRTSPWSLLIILHSQATSSGLLAVCKTRFLVNITNIHKKLHLVKIEGRLNTDKEKKKSHQT